MIFPPIFGTLGRSGMRRPSRADQSGAGLLEVMISVLIMGIGLLGIAAMQATALKNSQSSMERSQAVIQSYTILEAMRANRERALAGDYNIAQTCASAGNATLAQRDLSAWITSLKTALGDTDNTCGTVNCSADGNCTVTVQWDDSRATGNDGAGSATYQLATRTQL